MKIGQLTLPFNCNYGGILQAYALQRVLRSMGHDVIILDRQQRKKYDYSVRLIISCLLSVAKTIIRKYVFCEEGYDINNPFGKNYSPLSKSLDENLRTFIQERLVVSPPFYTTESLAQYVAVNRFDAIIVGSDQVWREVYTPCITDYFLTFLSDDKIKRIAYAASAGTEDLDIEESLLPVCGEGLKQFDAVSVREESARELLLSSFGVDSTVLLDPTMLLTQTDWQTLIKPSDYLEKNSLAHYILDTSEEKNDIIKDISHSLYLTKNELSASFFTSKGKPRKLDSISMWLSAFANASFVVTDSFHGCVFSILFKKPFIAIANKERGLSRFTTLLGHFGLQHRIVFSYEELEQRKQQLLEPIDYEPVNSKLEKLRSESLQFLIVALSASESH